MSESSQSSPSQSGPILTLDDSSEFERELTMAELEARAKTEDPRELPTTARPRARDDELLDEPPRGDHHLGRFAGWRAVATSRKIVGGTLALALIVGAVIFVQHSLTMNEQRERRAHERLHPLPEVEALIDPDTPREMTLSDGEFRIALGREAPAVNVLHLPDRDITLAPGLDKAQFKIEVRDGETMRIVVLTGEIRETLTAPEAEPLLD